MSRAMEVLTAVIILVIVIVIVLVCLRVLGIIKRKNQDTF